MKISKLAKLKKRDVIKCPPEDLVHMDWSKEWKPALDFSDETGTDSVSRDEISSG